VGHTAVHVQDSPGFLVNHIGRGLITEGLRLLYENVTDVQTVDAVMRDCAGFRMGPFELMDLTGLDVTYPASEQVYNQYFQEPRLRPTPLQQRRFIAGLLGRKTGQGFYRYREGKKVEGEEPPAPDTSLDTAVWIGRSVPDLAAALEALLKDTGVTLDTGNRPAAGSVALLTPEGHDATTLAVQEGADAERSVAVDMIFNHEKRITLMRTPVTDDQVAAGVHALLARTGRKVSVIRDSGGCVAQRVVATIVNIACEIAQQGIARPEDIDTGARLALAYPEGPLAMGDRIGAGRILAILENLQECYADPRYRPSPWLRRRAALGLSLLHGE
jgi:3-hydroxybutyryl-CoA dehydrogenase